MSPARESIEQALAEDPSREELWLLYADHLQVEGDPRGEFIALEQAKLQSPERRETLLEAQRELVAAHDARWRGALKGVPDLELTWKMGFIIEVDLQRRVLRTLETLRELSSTRFLQKLVIRGMDPARPTPQLWALVRLLEARHIKDLDLSYNALGTRGMKAFMSAHALSELRTLNLCQCEMGVGWLPSFSSVSWTNLQTLNLSHNLIAQRWMKVDAPSLQSLRALHLARVGLTDPALADIAARFELAQLRELDISQNPLSSRAHEAFLDKRAWPQLRRLNASDLELSTDDLTNLVRAVGALGLRTLRVGGAPRALSPIDALSRSPSGPSHQLELPNLYLTDNQVDALADIAWVEPLERILVEGYMPGARQALQRQPKLQK